MDLGVVAIVKFLHGTREIILFELPRINDKLFDYVFYLLCFAKGLDEMGLLEVELQKVSWMHSASQVMADLSVVSLKVCFPGYLPSWPT